MISDRSTTQFRNASRSTNRVRGRTQRDDAALSAFVFDRVSSYTSAMHRGRQFDSYTEKIHVASNHRLGRKHGAGNPATWLRISEGPEKVRAVASETTSLRLFPNRCAWPTQAGRSANTARFVPGSNQRHAKTP